VLSLLAASITVAKAAEKDGTTISTDKGDAQLPAITNNPASTDQPIFKFNGFGTLGVSHSSQSLGDYTIDNTVPKGPGLSQNWSFANDSRLGMQASANINPQTTAVLQVISEYQEDGDYRPEVEWANVKYDFNSKTFIRIGRIALPSFLYSDSRKVGYSYPWIHPPIEVYRQTSQTNSDGIDAACRFSVFQAMNTVKIIYGQTINDLPSSTTTSKNLKGIFDTLEFGSALFSVGYQDRNSTNYNALTGITTGPVTYSDITIGASYDPGDWFAIAEWIQRKSTTKVDAMYISTGRRISKFTPYFTYSQNSPASFVSVSPTPTASAIQTAKDSQNSVSLGLRWDFMKNTDAKLQFDQVRLSNNSNGYLANVPAGVTLYGTGFHVISAVVDFTF